jgi:hypothetical protein
MLFFVLDVKKLNAGAPGSRPTCDFIRWARTAVQMTMTWHVMDSSTRREI